ncbi:hypothetical protein LTR94_026606, partial [Friedmanniomyces endolithicus]
MAPMTARYIGLGLGLIGGLFAATQLFAWTYASAPVLGEHWSVGDADLYAPWMILVWTGEFEGHASDALGRSGLVLALVSVLGLGVGSLLEGRVDQRRSRGWGGLREAKLGGLLERKGVVIGRLKNCILTSSDLRPSLVIGGTRSGKGRGHVMPTLLSWTDSVMVHDPKSELWALTAGWRSTFSHVLRMDPRDLSSVRWNPLAEIRPGHGELAEVQRLVAVLSDPGGARDSDGIWDKAASEVLEAVILHVLFTAPADEKTLLTVRDLLADLDQTMETMAKTLHRRGKDGRPEVHPFIKTAAIGYSAMHDRFRTSVQGTARSYLKWAAGADMEHVLSGSDFILSDL